MLNDFLFQESNVFRQIKRFGGPTGPGSSTTRGANERFRQSFIDNPAEDEEHFQSSPSPPLLLPEVDISEESGSYSPSRERKTGAIPKNLK